MSLSSSHQSHMNIMESRRHAVKILTRETGMQYFLNGMKIAKGKLITYITMGYFDGFHYLANYADKCGHIENDSNSRFLHKIGH